jgi:hypothetical protein
VRQFPARDRNRNAGKDPKKFILQHIELHDFGPKAPWQYNATLVNAVPLSEIHAAGTFGP